MLEVRLESIEETQKEWKQLFKNAVASAARWLASMIVMGLLFGWHLPEEMRKRMAGVLEWLSK